jgi:hypothetical protein
MSKLPSDVTEDSVMIYGQAGDRYAEVGVYLIFDGYTFSYEEVIIRPTSKTIADCVESCKMKALKLIDHWRTLSPEMREAKYQKWRRSQRRDASKLSPDVLDLSQSHEKLIKVCS